MTKIQQELFHRAQTAKDFFFYKTDEMDRKKEGMGNDKTLSMVFDQFPKMLSGKEFLDAVAEILSPVSAFAVMVFKTDGTHESGETPFTTAPGDILQMVDTLCVAENGFWGQLEPFVFACFLPNATIEIIDGIAGNFQNRAASETGKTLTMGLASYPTPLAYEKQRILECALKALEHARFFGANSKVAFDAVSLNISGDNLYQKGDMEGAISEYADALKLDPRDVNVLNSMGVCHGVMGDLDTALSFFGSAVACDPHEVMGWYNMALVYKLKGDKKKALDFFLKADAVKQDSFEIAFQTGKIYFETGDAETGAKYYRRVLALAEHTRGNHRFVGDCHLALGETEKALKAYETAVKENPGDAHALSALGALYDTKGENPEIAMVLCQQSVDIAPQNSLFRRRLAKLHLKQGRFDAALVHFKAAENMDATLGPGENQEGEKSPCGCEKDRGIPSVASAEG